MIQLYKTDKVIYAVTHGERFPGANPSMTLEGIERIVSLRPLLPENPTEIPCGVGIRHLQVASALNLTPTSYSPVVGNADSLEKLGDEKVVVLASGMVVPNDVYRTMDLAPSARALVIGLPSDSVIPCGRPLMIALSKPDAKSGTVYRIVVRDDEIEAIEEIPVEE